MGASKLAEIFDEAFYNAKEGGLLGGLGQLFKNNARLYVYPSLNLATGHVMNAANFPIVPHLSHLYAYLRENRFIQEIENYNPEFLPIRSKEVLRRLQSGDTSWEGMVPGTVVKAIKAERLFGYMGSQSPAPSPSG
jgi:hypothetical protein